MRLLYAGYAACDPAMAAPPSAALASAAWEAVA